MPVLTYFPGVLGPVVRPLTDLGGGTIPADESCVTTTETSYRAADLDSGMVITTHYRPLTVTVNADS